MSCFFAPSAAAAPGLAQTVEFEGRKATDVAAPQDAQGQARAEALRRAGFQSEITYLQKFDGALEQKDPAKRRADAPPDAPLLGAGWVAGNTGIVIVFVVAALALGLWVYFGGGALLAPDTAARPKKPTQTPDGCAQNLTDLGQNQSLADMADRPRGVGPAWAI